MHDTYTGCADSPRIDGARNQTFLNVPKKISFKTFFFFICTIWIYHSLSYTTCPKMTSPRKKRPPPLHVSVQRIVAERANVIQRTNNRIRSLNAAEREDRTARAHGTETDNWHCCLNTICFCMLLVLLNLLFWQWLYYKSLNLNLKQL
jgi:hypothetical protein